MLLNPEGIIILRRKYLYMPVNVFDLQIYAQFIRIRTLNILAHWHIVIRKKPEDDWMSPIFHAEPRKHQPWVKYYRESALTASYSRLTIRYSQSIERISLMGRRVALWLQRRWQNRLVLLRKQWIIRKMQPLVDITCPRWSDFTIHYLSLPCHSNDSIMKLYEAIYAHALLYILQK